MTQATLVAYAGEIGPLVRKIDTKKQIIKDFKETDERAIELTEAIKEATESAKAELKAYVERENAELLDEIKALEGELKLAIKAAARSTKGTQREYKASDLTPYFKARNKTFEQGKVPPVKKVIDKGGMFNELETKLGPGEV